MEPHDDDPKTEQDNNVNDLDKVTPRLTNNSKSDEKPAQEELANCSSGSCLIGVQQPGDGKNDGVRRSNTSIEGQFRCAVTSDRLNQLRKTVEMAVREHKTFTIKGT